MVVLTSVGYIFKTIAYLTVWFAALNHLAVMQYITLGL